MTALASGPDVPSTQDRPTHAAQARCLFRAAEREQKNTQRPVPLDGKNAAKLWDPENLALKCESAVIIESKEHKKETKHTGWRDVKAKQLLEGSSCQRFYL